MPVCVFVCLPLNFYIDGEGNDNNYNDNNDNNIFLWEKNKKIVFEFISDVLDIFI